ncbi:MAG: class D beta-lactamase [Bacteroidia bacterium]
MKSFFKSIKFLITILSTCGLLVAQNNNTIIRNDLKSFYDAQGLEGSFSLFNEKDSTYLLYNPSQFKTAYSPASTFKICNSLIGLESGVIWDENFIIKWDSVQRPNPKWNADHDLKTAFKNSTVWYYREMARRIGGKRMKAWLNKAEYGNTDTTGGVDLFWLKGGLRITPEQQIDFLRRFNNYKLPFTKPTVDIVKKIMVVEDTLGYMLRAKTGWADNELEPSIGWYVGYVETKDNTYYFANCIQTKDFDKAKARIYITYQILRELGIIPKDK